MQIAGSTFLIAGGASGLGAACAEYFIKHKASVVIADMNAKMGSALATKLGKNAKFVQTNVADEESTKHAVDLAWETFGNLSGAVNCAGVGIPEKTVEKKGRAHSLDNFTKTIQINLIGTFNVARLVASSIIQRKPNVDGERGIIINTASLAAFEGQIGQVSYSASKGGVVAMTLPMARDLASFGVRVMAIAPGIFDTPLIDSLSEHAKSALASQIPFPQRLGKAEEFAQLVASIVENEMLNGTVIRIDGAMRMSAR